MKHAEIIIQQNLQEMSQQNKTEKTIVQAQQQPKKAAQILNPVLQSPLQQPTSYQQHNESKIQIVLHTKDGHEQCQSPPLKLIESNESSNQHLTKTLEPILISSGGKNTPQNENEISAVCIDLCSENETLERKGTFNSVQQSRILMELRREIKAINDKGIQTEEIEEIESKQEEHSAIREDRGDTEKEEKLDRRLCDFDKKDQNLKKNHQDQVDEIRKTEFIEYVKVESDGNGILVNDDNQIVRNSGETQEKNDQSETPKFQNTEFNIQTSSEVESSKKSVREIAIQTQIEPLIKIIEIPLQKIEHSENNIQKFLSNRLQLIKVQEDDQSDITSQLAQVKVSQSRENQISQTKLERQPQLFEQPFEQQQDYDEQTSNFLKTLKESQYDNVILQLTQKLMRLQKEFKRLIPQSQPSPMIPSKEIKDLQTKQNNQQLKIVSQDQIEFRHSFGLEISKSNQQIQQSTSSRQKNLQISQTYLITIQSPKKDEEEISLKNNLKSNQPSQSQQVSQMKQAQTSAMRLLIANQFSSGQVQNLLVESESQLIDLRDLQGPQEETSKESKTEHHLSEIPIVLESDINTKIISQTPAYSPTILATSQSNLAIVKQSWQQLPYQRLNNIMKLKNLVSKISFKQKHFPSSCSTQKQLKLYGKRLIRLLADQSTFENNMLTLQNDLQYDQNAQSIVYYLKNNHQFVIICYFNHTIYIGQYTTQGPMQEIIRQGYGIQVRESKYVYQGQFFADKKHGYGFVQFTGKNSFIYCGYFLDGFMDGHGKSMNESGQIYIGDFKLGQKDGVGKVVYNAERGIYYEGEFYDGFKSGKGYEVFENGDSYTGSYARDKFQGQGEYKWKNGAIYQGNFLDGYKHGKGLLTHANGKTFEKYYDHNKEINLDDEKKTIKSSRISTISQSKIEEKTLIQQKPKNLRNARSMSGQSLFSHKSRSGEKSLKMVKDKRKISQILRQKQIQEDLKNLDKILKQPTDENRLKKIFSVKKIDTRDKIIGKMYNTIERPWMKISQNSEMDLYKLSKMGSQRKSLISFDSQDKLEQLKDSSRYRGVQRTTNFSQF